MKNWEPCDRGLGAMIRSKRMELMKTELIESIKIEFGVIEGHSKSCVDVSMCVYKLGSRK